MSDQHGEPGPSAPTAVVRVLVIRFGLLYWGGWVLSLLLGAAIEASGLTRVEKAIDALWSPVVLWTARHVLSIPYAFSTDDTGSGDKTADWVSLFLRLCIALVGCALWTAIARRRPPTPALREGLRVGLRYALSFVLLGYGTIKLFFGQFSPPNEGRLLQAIGETSPMGLLWTFMGASPAYVFFSGAGETLGALLLLWRRTTTLGALVLGAVLTNVVMLNCCYDVPVKINSSHYLVMCGLLIAPDLRRLAAVLVLNRPAAPATLAFEWPRPWTGRARLALKALVIAPMLVGITHQAWRATRPRPEGAWYDGYWSVASFARDGVVKPALVDDATRWKGLRFQQARDRTLVRWRFMDGSTGGLYRAAIDEAEHKVVLTADPSGTPGPALTFERPAQDRLRLAGSVDGGELVVELRRLDRSKMLLVSRGFHWVNETPFNR